jgi:glutamyl-tRNA reductase
MALLAVGLNHRTAPLDLLERLSVAPDDLPKALARLARMDAIHECVVLSTCNRVEAYAAVPRFHPAVRAVRAFLSDMADVSEADIAGGMYTYYEDAAARHLFRVASGIDSMVVGESQILGQVRDAFAVADAEGTAERTLHPLFQRALRAGRRARAETTVGEQAVSVPAAAARLASELAARLDDVVIVGAGRTAELAAHAVLEVGARRLVFANRTHERAARLATRMHGQASSLDGLDGVLVRADVVIATTSAPYAVIDRGTFERAVAIRSAPLVAIDIAVPRDIDASVRTLPGVVLKDLEDLRHSGDAAALLGEVPTVERIVSEEVERYCAWRRSLAAGPAIARLRRRAEALRAAEVAAAARRAGLDDDGRAALDKASRALVNKLLHAPITRIKQAAEDAAAQEYLEVFQELFDLDAGDQDR